MLLTGVCIGAAAHSWWQVRQLINGPVAVNRWIYGIKRSIVVGPGKKGWVALDEMSLYGVYAILVAEDDRFFRHSGLDLVEIRKSLALNWQKKRIVRGASTITQQVVKLAFLDNRRTWSRKINEIFGAIVLDAILDKSFILEWYLNLVPFGPSIYGIEAGAKKFFDKKPELLTVEDAVQLALVIPSPNRRSLLLRKKHLENSGQRRFYSILSKMRDQGYITSQQWNQALAQGNFGRPILYRSH